MQNVECATAKSKTLAIRTNLLTRYCNVVVISIVSTENLGQ